MSNFFSSVNTRFGSVPSAIYWRISLHFGPSWPHDWPYAADDAVSWRASLPRWCIVDLLTPAAVTKVLQLRREFCRNFSLVFLRSWEERTLRFLPRPGRSRAFPVSWNLFTIFHTVELFISSRLKTSTLLFQILWRLITAFRSTAIVK